MSSSLKAFLLSLIVGIGFVWVFIVWRSRTLTGEAEHHLSFIEQLEKSGIPDLQLEDIAGHAFKTGDMKHKVLLINFWASFCAPCLEEFPSMLKLLKEMDGQMELLAISQDTSVEEIRAFLKSFPEANDPKVHIVLDKDRKLAQQFGVDRLPESFLAGSGGKLAKKIIGSIHWYTPDSIKYVRSLSAAK
ncbi:MAG: TlpA family protein disulfide reductase [Bdellovibrio sp.]|nr:MAG: TlpA family protein disulfide reductase [Bdellovibrio sp.]